MDLNKKRTNIYSPSDASIAFILCMLVPQIVMLIVFMVLGESGAKSQLASALVPQLSFVPVCVFVSERKKVNYKKANSINFKINPLVLLLVIVIGVVCIFGFSPFTNLVDYLTFKLGYKSSATNIDVSTVGKLVACLFYIALLPAICEEFLFRGILTHGFKKYGTVATVTLSAVLFALMHQNLQQLVYQLFLGAVMAYIVVKTGSIIYTMCLHFFNNAFILIESHVTNATLPDYSSAEYAEYYGNAWNVVWPILVMLLSVAIVVGLLFLMTFILKKFKKQPEAENAQVEEAQKLEETEQKNEEAKPKGMVATYISNALDDADKHDKFYKNPFVISAIVVGIIFWILTVVSLFK